MSQVVQSALRNALDEKADDLVAEVKGAALRFQNTTTNHSVRAHSLGQNFVDTIEELTFKYRREIAEIDTAMQRDLEEDR